MFEFVWESGPWRFVGFYFNMFVISGRLIGRGTEILTYF